MMFYECNGLVDYLHTLFTPRHVSASLNVQIADLQKVTLRFPNSITL